MKKKILKAIEEAYRKGLRDAKGLNDIRPYLVTSQVVAHELANKFCQPLVVKKSEQCRGCEESTEDLKCVLDSTNQTSYNWKEITEDVSGSLTKDETTKC